MMTSRVAQILVVLVLQVTFSTGSLTRKNVAHLDDREILDLEIYLHALEEDHTITGYQTLASWHGEPSQCTDDEGHKVACCVHGSATFPQWHRLYVVQLEQLLNRHDGQNIGIPYWDWTEPIIQLPYLVREPIYSDPNGLGHENSWFSGEVKFGNLDTHTARGLDSRLFERVAPGAHTRLLDLVLDALEEDDYCHFEVQFEVAHNHIHYLVGGRYEYSMSTLEYTSYDPLFFLHHSNVDRIFTIWLELQKLRGKAVDHSDCSAELFRKPLQPFADGSNPVKLTFTYSKPKDLFSNLHLGYTYEDLTLDGKDIHQLNNFLEQRHARERAFAEFTLHSLGYSADVRVQVCEHDDEEHDHHDDHCVYAGDFFILGGAKEMEWKFTHPYYFDISAAVEKLGEPLDGVFEVRAEIFNVNGTALPDDVLPPPRATHRPAKGYTDPIPPESHKHDDLVRRDVAFLTREEVFELRQALSRFQNDSSVEGFQAIAEFHGLPARCPRPDARIRYACCVHGSPIFPHWHRLFVVQFEDALHSRGFDYGIPYWDWTRPRTEIPSLASNKTYVDPYTQQELHNPFHDAAIAFLGQTTSRSPLPSLTQDPVFGDHTFLYDSVLLAFEQTDYCDFEVQFEVIHNLIHLLVGGGAPYSLSTLHYSAFDPIFYLHHSNVDRLWAIWQALQIYRHLPYKAHCANSLTHEPLKPFAFNPPLNSNPKTHKYSTGQDLYNYEEDLGYTYDTLQFGGLSIAELEHYIEERQTADRTFVGIHLHSIKTSAGIKVSLLADGQTYVVGTVAVLGGESEMPWTFDRLFKLEITDGLKAIGRQYDDEFEVHLEITDVSGHVWPENTFSHNTIIHLPGTVHEHKELEAEIHVRTNIDSLTAEQLQNLREAMQALEEDTSIFGFGQLAAFHGEPKWCPSPDAEKKYACCAHGVAVFPHWHRLLTAQAEDGLISKGFVDGLPYWDWTRPLTGLPAAVEPDTYVNPKTGQSEPNPLHHGVVDGHATKRQNRPELFQQPKFGQFTLVAETVLLALEQTNFCDFEVQFEVAHNYIHALVGGNEEYSMASLRYTSFDPLFYFHHSNTDRLWALWQEIQKHRGLPYNTANCALAALRKPLQPFAQSSVTNPDRITRDHSVPLQVFDYRHTFHYDYDHLEFSGLSIPQIEHEIVRRQSHDRIFAGFLLHSIGTSALVTFEICDVQNDCQAAGEFYILGDENEMPWNYDRLFKYEITNQLKERHIDYRDRFYIAYDVKDLDGHSLGHNVFNNATTVLDRAAGWKDEEYKKELLSASHVRKNVNSLSEGELESFRAAFHDIEEDGTFEKIAKFHGYPGLCENEGHKVACCVHGSAIFPHWHRLYVEEVEDALLAHGSSVSVPYWDWTQNFDDLPAIVGQASYFDSRSQSKVENPLFHGFISDLHRYTNRDPQYGLFDSHYLLENVLLALEQTNFCDFEIQFEIVHNAIHALVGGRARYSLSTLDYSAFDPLFVLHHASTDRIWAIWQSLQRLRRLPYDESNCALNLMRRPLKPFDDDKYNEQNLTHEYSSPADVFDYTNHFNYRYDTLDLNSWNIDQLEAVLKNRRSEDRLFAGFLLNNIDTSAVIEIFICVPRGEGSHDCNHSAGKFALLGGEYEMPYTFDRLYKFEISDAVRKLGFRLDSAAEFELHYEIHAYNGSYLEPDAIHEPSIIFEPGVDHHQDEKGRSQRNLVRKNAWALSPSERRSLVLALKAMQSDTSADGFQSIAAFHAVPPLCPNPKAHDRYACCVHGQATFPQWHRLYTVQFEDSLRRRGALVGIPYWDSVKPSSHLPDFFSEKIWHDPELGIDFPNPWYQSAIDYDHTETVRDVQTDRLSQTGHQGHEGWQFEQFIYALEQENYCDFEVQFEIAHNAIHAWVGGHQTHSMAHLHFASYDPVFLLHHSNTDRIYAVWQELQKHRGLDPNEPYCALDLMREPLRPFSFGPPYNLNPITRQFSRPRDAFNYKEHFNYEYDKLDLEGVEVERLIDLIIQNQERDRVFAGFLLKGIGTSAHVEYFVCTDSESCVPAGDFNILGGAYEHPWSFDRLYKSEITDALKTKGLHYDDHFDIKVTITALNGTQLDPSLIPTPSIIHLPQQEISHSHLIPPNHIRQDLPRLDERGIQSLKASLRDLQNDQGKNGWQALAAFHGVPALCPTPEAAEYACCIHGSPTFPNWHRLYTLQVEQALLNHGSSVALPYWDWTRPIEKLPALFTSETYHDAWRDKVVNNPFARGFIKEANGYTTRDPQPELYKVSHDGHHSVLFDELLLALEQTDYCDFEVQFEVLHNAIHYLVGGRHVYALSSLHYSSYDPIFFLHHSFVDKIWAVWQELQRLRHLPYDHADCAVNFMTDTLHPFDSETLNVNPFTRQHAVAQTLFDYEGLRYHYDNLNIGDKSPQQLEELIHAQKSHPRVFAGFLLHGIGTSADVIFYICKTGGHCSRAGAFFILGGSLEHPWSYNRLYKYDITDALLETQIQPEAIFDSDLPFYIDYEITAVNNSVLPKSTLPKPTIIFEPAEGHSSDSHAYSIAGVGVRKDINTLTTSEVKNLKAALRAVQLDDGPFGYEHIAEAHGYPGLCQEHGHATACCHHGSASFPQWHRLFVRQLELALTFKGADVGVPYWDWTEAFTELPRLLTDENDNPFHHGHIKDLDQDTSRAPRNQLFNDPEHGEQSFFYRQILLAFQQRDYCDFEIQFEITHNAIHSWVGGTSHFGMSTLEYSAFDPLFFIHHSNVDRQFAIWQELQKYRGLDYNTANCDIQELHKPLEPFSWSTNEFHIIRDHARAIDAFDYDQFNYQYDNLNFHGLTIPQLHELLEEKEEEDHVFVNFLIHNLHTSADVTFDLCDAENHCSFAGTFALLGGPLEMDWHFDRLFKYDVTDVFHQKHLQPYSVYHFDIHITAVNGTSLNPNLIAKHSVSFQRGRKHGTHHDDHDDPQPTESEDVIRYETSALTLEQITNLKNALYRLQSEHGSKGYEAIAGYHGAPYLCPFNATQQYACCVHGMPVFPHYHRLLTVQFERALVQHGAKVGIPYWDWTHPSRALPYLITDPTNNNPFLTYNIGFVGHWTSRNVSSKLFQRPTISGEDFLFHQALATLEETNYCDFEVQFEILHNALHYLVGGPDQYSMSTLDYSAFDPFFLIHHSAIDRIWQIWQKLQKLRHKPFNFARCAYRWLNKPLEPFSYSSNPNELTRNNARPISIFDSDKFHYHFDNLKLNGHTVEEIHQLITSHRSENRIYVGLILSGIATSAKISVDLVIPDHAPITVGSFYVLGGPREMPWAYERPYKLDITDTANQLQLGPYATFNLQLTITRFDGQPLENHLPSPVIIYRPANVDYEVLILHISPSLSPTPKIVVRRGTRIRFELDDPNLSVYSLRELGSYTNWALCIIPPASANSYYFDQNYSLPPGDYYFTSNNKDRCLSGRRIQITVEEE